MRSRASFCRLCQSPASKSVLAWIAASATLGGPLAAAPLAAGGATFFYASDASLALNRFRRPIPHAAFFTLGLYWIGQIGIALAARGGP